MRQFIRFEATKQRFYFCDEVVPLRRLGASLAYALASGKQVQLHFCERDRTRDRFRRRTWSVMVEPSYVEQMLRFIADNGWFYDEVEEHVSSQESDHAFDPKNITPGLNWRVVTDMRQGADWLDKQAQRLEYESTWHQNSRRKNEFEADVAGRRQRAASLREAAAQMLIAGVPPL